MAAAGQRTGILSSFADLFSDEEPDMKGKLVVFDPQVFNRTQTELKDWSANRKDWQNVYKDFKTDWEAGQPAAEDRAKQETGFLDKFYNGDFASYLSGLRNKEGQARRAAGDRALEYARGATDRASLLRGEPTGNSSASRAMAYRLGKDIENEVALNDVARERGDFDYITRGQQGNLGARTALVDAVTKRQLAPHQLNNSELLFMNQLLAGIQGVRMGSASPVFWREKGTAEQVGDVLDTFADSAYKGANAATTFSGMGGGMGGGGGGGMGGMSKMMGGGGGGAAPSGGGGASPGYSMPVQGGSFYPGSVNPYSNPAPQWYDSAPSSSGQEWLNYGSTFG